MILPDKYALNDLYMEGNTFLRKSIIPFLFPGMYVLRRLFILARIVS